jgi:hypothetical protein
MGIPVPPARRLRRRLICGALAAAGAIARDEGPAYLENWRAGAEGEHKTHEVLLSLGWHLVEDIDHGRGNYDHLIVGPPGVFMFETKNPTGTVEVHDGEPWLVRKHDPEGRRALRDLARKARRDSAAVNAEIERRSELSTWVSAVVVLWSDFPQGVVEADRVAYVHGSQLRDWLLARPHRLDPDSEARVAGALAGLKAEGAARTRAGARRAATD